MKPPEVNDRVEFYCPEGKARFTWKIAAIDGENVVLERERQVVTRQVAKLADIENKVITILS